MTGNFVSSLNLKSKTVASDKKPISLDKNLEGEDFKKTMDASLKENRVRKEKKSVKDDFTEASKLGLTADFAEKNEAELREPLIGFEDSSEEAVLIDNFTSIKAAYDWAVEEDIYVLRDLKKLDQPEKISFTELETLAEDGNLFGEVTTEIKGGFEASFEKVNEIDSNSGDDFTELSKLKLDSDRSDIIEKIDEDPIYEGFSISDRVSVFNDPEPLSDEGMEKLELEPIEETLKASSSESVDLEEEAFSLDFDDSRININPSVITTRDDVLVEETVVDFISPSIIEENMDRVGNSIIKLLETSKIGETSSMKVKLYPKELGNVDLLLTMNDSKLELKILVDNQNVKDMFNENIKKLSENLAKQSISLQGFSVDVNQGFDFNQGRPGFENSRSFGKSIKSKGDVREDLSYEKERASLNVDDGSISILA